MSSVRALAFYLPQYHPIPENDLWWGEGFTDWENVARAKPLWEGHYQPRVPGALGYYDLRLPETRAKQAELAETHGIYGFCYYYYWFNGRRLLEKPLNGVLQSGEPDRPFCVCWANENWTRRWDGKEEDVLMGQSYCEENHQQFARELIPVLQDPRYIRIGGKPLVIIYRCESIPDTLQAVATWREVWRKEMGEELHLCSMMNFGHKDPAEFGFDATIEFPPHDVLCGMKNKELKLPKKFKGQIFDYAEAVAKAKTPIPRPDARVYPGVMAGWDNSPRRGKRAGIYVNSTPQAYEEWLRAAVGRAAAELPEGEQFVFVNAWNEWAEGAYLEPDQKWGYEYLKATRRAMGMEVGHTEAIRRLEEGEALEGEEAGRIGAHLREVIDQKDRALHHLQRMVVAGHTVKTVTKVYPFVPGDPLAEIPAYDESLELHCFLEQFGLLASAGELVQPRASIVKAAGWAFLGASAKPMGDNVYLLIWSEDETEKYYARLGRGIPRPDLLGRLIGRSPAPEDDGEEEEDDAEAEDDWEGKRLTDEEQRYLYSGWDTRMSLAAIPPGDYKVGIAVRAGKENRFSIAAWSAFTLKIVA